MKQKYENKDIFIKTFSKEIWEKCTSFKEKIVNQDNLLMVQSTYKGLNIEKIRGTKNEWSARLNKKYRIQFTTDNNELIKIIKIVILKIHPHNY
ncbi:hypothetical protein [Candidatus Mycoplasma mahonii]|uniref:hypothetical protein n=1 Tax=Candidatus Mycoplasma mahonii TaxID=3004105 RepID=UPI0026EB3460|nr:hypothetical protein [Candidatus Mycoplasma mahonii]WKX02288.1 hypothetical protein O3I44_02690 [Candidatus Mycoplasma mahonii]